MERPAENSPPSQEVEKSGPVQHLRITTRTLMLLVALGAGACALVRQQDRPREEALRRAKHHFAMATDGNEQNDFAYWRMMVSELQAIGADHRSIGIADREYYRVVDRIITQERLRERAKRKK